MHGLVALFLGVIVLVIILFVIGLGTFQVLVVTSRAIVALVLSMMVVRSVIVAIAFVASMIVTVVTTAMLTVAQFTATRGRNMSRLFSFGCFLSLAILSRTPAALSVA